MSALVGYNKLISKEKSSSLDTSSFPVKKFPICYGSRSIVTVFTTSRKSCNIYPTRCNITQFIWKMLHMFRVVPPPIVRSANNCIYSILYLSHRYCYLPLSWKSLNWSECAVGGVRHPQHTQISSNSSTIAADSNNGVTNTRCCRYSCLRSM